MPTYSELRFTDVGVTPNNKYRVWIDRESRLVSQWAFYADAEDAEPRFIGPWQRLAAPRSYYAVR